MSPGCCCALSWLMAKRKRRPHKIRRMRQRYLFHLLKPGKRDKAGWKLRIINLDRGSPTYNRELAFFGKYRFRPLWETGILKIRKPNHTDILSLNPINYI